MIQQHVPTQTLLQDQFRVVSLLVVNMGTPNPEEPQNHRKVRTGYTQERMNKGSTCGRKQPSWKDLTKPLGGGGDKARQALYPDCRCIKPSLHCALYIVHIYMQYIHPTTCSHSPNNALHLPSNIL